MLHTSRKSQSQSGMSMIEILITIVISAVGLLGLAGMQMVSLKNVNNTQFRTLATIYAYDMAERMRSNRAGVDANGYDAIDGTETDPGCTPCSAAQIAQADAYQWNQLLKASVENGGFTDGAVGTITANGALHDITVSWSEQSRDTGAMQVDTKSFTLTVRI